MVRKLIREIPLCACGCGEKVKWNKKNKKWNIYINYHNNRCKSQESIDKMRKSLKGHTPWNKGLTKENNKIIKQIAKKLSKTLKENPRDPWNKGLTKETDKRVKRIAKNLSIYMKENPRELTESVLNNLKKGNIWCKGLTKEKDKRVADRAIKTSKALKGRKNKEQSIRLKKLYKKHPEKHPNYILGQKANGSLQGKTYIEEVFSKLLEKLKIKALYNYHVGRYWIDFGIVDKKIGFECDGEYWHKDKEKDKRRDEELKNKYGWSIYRFSGKDINKNINKCKATVKGVIRGCYL